MDYIYHGKDNENGYTSVNIYADGFAKSSAKVISDYLDTDSVKKETKSPLVFADFGSGDGVLALKTYKLVSDTLTRSLQREMIVILNDIADTNLGFISKNVQESGLQEESGVTVLLSRKDFFSSCSPSSYIDVSMSHLTLGYIRSLTIENELFYTCVNVTDTERMMFKEQMKDNWRRFLGTRSQELKPGGMLFVSWGMARENITIVYQEMSDTWKSLYTTGVITQKEFRMATVATYCPTKEDIMSPFVNNIYSGLKVMKFQPLPVGDWWTQVDKHGQPSCTAAVFAEKLTASMQSFTRCFIEAALSESENRSSSEKEDIVDLFYEKTRTAIEERIKFIPDYLKIGQILLQKIE